MPRKVAIYGFIVCVLLLIFVMALGIVIGFYEKILSAVLPERIIYIVPVFMIPACLLLIIFGFVNFFSIMMSMLIKADPSYEIIRKSGSPFHYLV
ncbi:hypothetical protein SAMN05880593_10477 [Rhizobium sp. RU36D]|nr:hypothetical protein SAMN05880593_10477 [Rhizobium sp. RU36D]